MTGTIQRGKITRADLAHWDGTTSTYSRPDATGGTVTGLAVGNEVDVLQVFGVGTARTRTTMADAVQRIGSAACTLGFAPGTWTIDANLTIPSNLTCHIPRGCVFSVDAGKTLTFSGPVIAESETFYSGSGTTVLSVDSIVGGKPWIARSAAEIAAAVTPVSYSYQPLISVRYGNDWTQWQSVAANTASSGWYNLFTRRGATSTALGEAALITETASGNANTGFGYQALKANTDGSENTAIGKSCLEANTTGGDNTGVGFSSLKVNTTGEKNTSVGSHNMEANTTGSFNTACGQNCLDANTTGNENTAVGQGALFNNTTGSDNTAVGEHALLSNTTSNDNTAVGAYALEDCTGTNNVGVGRNAGQNISTGHENTAIGKDALANVTTASENTAVGHGALNANTGAGNTAVGQAALNVNSSGTANTAVGHRALVNNTTAAGSTAVGEDALVASTGGLNTAVGKNAALGTTSGAGVTALGHSAGATNTTGGTNTFIGYTADANAGNYSNTTALGNAATCTASNQVTLGNASIATLRCQQTSITALSDARFKKNIRPLDIPDAALMDLEVVVYEWIDMEMPQGPQVGFIAQLLAAWQSKWGLEWLNLVDFTNPDRLEATPGKLIFPLILGFQRLSARVAALEAR